MVCHKSLNIHDGNRFIQITPSANGLTGMGANASADAGQNVIFPDKLKRLGKPAGFYKGDIALGVHPQRTVFLAERPSPFIDDRPAGKASLTVNLDGFFSPGKQSRAYFNTTTAKRTFVLIYKGLGDVQVNTESLAIVLNGGDFCRKDASNARVS
jgi:hypothetical protein